MNFIGKKAYILGFMKCVAGEYCQVTLNNYFNGELIRNVIFGYSPSLDSDKDNIYLIEFRIERVQNELIYAREYKILKLIDRYGDFIS